MDGSVSLQNYSEDEWVTILPPEPWPTVSFKLRAMPGISLKVPYEKNNQT